MENLAPTVLGHRVLVNTHSGGGTERVTLRPIVDLQSKLNSKQQPSWKHWT